MTATVVKRLKGGCFLLKVCPDDQGFTDPGNSDRSDQPGKSQEEQDWEINIPEVVPKVNLSTTIEGKKSVNIEGHHYIAEPVPVSVPMEIPSQSPSYVPLTYMTPVYNGSEIGRRIRDNIPEIDVNKGRLPDINPVPKPEINTSTIDNLRPTAVIHGNQGSPKPILVPQRHDTLEEVKLINKASRTTRKVATKMDAISAALDFVDYITDYDVLSVEPYLQYLPQVIEGTEEAVAAAAEYIEAGDLLGLGNIAFQVTPVVPILSLGAKVADSLGNDSLADEIRKGLSAIPRAKVNSTSYNFQMADDEGVVQTYTLDELIDKFESEGIESVEVPGVGEVPVADFVDQYRTTEEVVEYLTPDYSPVINLAMETTSDPFSVGNIVGSLISGDWSEQSKVIDRAMSWFR